MRRHKHTHTHFLYSWLNSIIISRKKHLLLIPLTLELELGHALQVKNKNTLLLSTFMNIPYSFFPPVGKTVTPVVFT